MLADVASRNEVLVALIAAVSLLGATFIQNFRGFRRATDAAKIAGDTAATAANVAASEAANGAAAMAREEMRSAVRGIERELGAINAKLDDLGDALRAVEDDAIEKNGGER